MQFHLNGVHPCVDQDSLWGCGGQWNAIDRKSGVLGCIFGRKPPKPWLCPTCFVCLYALLRCYLFYRLQPRLVKVLPTPCPLAARAVSYAWSWNFVFTIACMSSYLVSEYSSPLPPPPPPSPKWEDVDVDQRPILERENDDDGPPSIRGPLLRNQLPFLLPPAPPTSRGPSFDEPLCTQNARSSADLWLLALWFEHRLGRMDARVDMETSHSPHYADTVLLPELSWDGGYDARGSLIQSYHSSDDDGDTAISESSSTMGTWSRLSSSRDSSSTYQAAYEDHLTSKHHNFATDNLKELENVMITAKEPYPSVKTSPPQMIATFPNTTAQPVQSCKDLRQCSYVQYKNFSEPFINTSSLSPRILSPALDDPDRCTIGPDASKSCSGRASSNPPTPAEPATPTVERSVWEADEPEGRFNILASKLHLPINLRRGQRRARLRTRISRFFRCFLCCRTDETDV